MPFGEFRFAGGGDALFFEIPSGFFISQRAFQIARALDRLRSAGRSRKAVVDGKPATSMGMTTHKFPDRASALPA
jgi:hypothetical protein